MSSKLSKQIAQHIREVFFGKNWTWSWLKQHLDDITWQEATTQVYSLNTIAALVFHIDYYIEGLLNFFKNGELEINDKFSFDCPTISSDADWQHLKDKMYADAEKFACLIETLPQSKLWEPFIDKKTGNYYRNIHGIIEHTHYHLGQIVLIKKILYAHSKNLK